MREPLFDKGEVGDCICGDEQDEGATRFYREENVKEAIKELIDVIPVGFTSSSKEFVMKIREAYIQKITEIFGKELTQ